ncbi:uncharacterized protein LOC129335195 [Eublepharis macularius]|uniref:Uncharacterized protein LOC129335195 n=1 Tax=Eublepharis macularius TaxID=481883 RepID=A0AA97JSA9_EUBMA|nr:uncharacterized protein LOC129335195 [Eublepharis macularius]
MADKGMEASEEERLDEMLAACSQFEQFVFFTLQRMLHRAKEKEEKLLRHEESLRNYQKEAEDWRSEIKVFKEQVHDVKSRIDEIQRRIKDELQNEQQAVKEANETIAHLQKTNEELQREVKEAKGHAEFWERKCSEQRPSIISEKGHPQEGEEGEEEVIPSATKAADVEEDLLKRPSFTCPSSVTATPRAPPVEKSFLEESVSVQDSATEEELFPEVFRRKLTSTPLMTTEEPSSQSEPSTSREGTEPSPTIPSKRQRRVRPEYKIKVPNLRETSQESIKYYEENIQPFEPKEHRIKYLSVNQAAFSRFWVSRVLKGTYPSTKCVPDFLQDGYNLGIFHTKTFHPKEATDGEKFWIQKLKNDYKMLVKTKFEPRE